MNLASGRHMEACIPMPTCPDATGSKHAFLVMAHKDDEVLRALMRVLDDERNDIFIHMDAKKADGKKIACWLLSVRRGSF